MLRGLLFFLFMVPTLVFAGSTKGEKLVRKFFKEVQEKKLHTIEEHTASCFQRVDVGGTYNRAQELATFKAITLNSYTLSNFKQTRKDNLLIVTFDAIITTTVSGQTTTTHGPRLAVWQKVRDEWKRIAYAAVDQ